MSIKAKIILANVAVFSLFLLAFALIVYDRTRESEMAKLDSQLDVLAAGFITEFEDEWEENRFPEVIKSQQIITPSLSGIRIELLDASGNAVFSEGSLPAADAQQVLSAFSNAPEFETIRVNDTDFRQLIRPVEIREKIGFVLRLAAPMTDLQSRLHNLIAVLVIAVPTALFLSAFAVYFITRFAFKPMTQMVDAAEQISGSSLHHRLKTPSSRDEVRRLADALNEMMDRIEQAFNSQRQFVSDASHELRTPLTILYSELEFLKRSVNEDKLQDGITVALSETDRLSRLVDQLLLLARIDAGRLVLDIQPVRLDELLVDCLKLLRTQAEMRRVKLNLRFDKAIEIDGDGEQLKRVFINVMENALKYSPPSGQVLVFLEKENDNTAVVTIQDQGPGIAPADVPNIFKRFFRTSDARADHVGSGLGLAIAKELVEAHGGYISVESKPGAGTTVRISLPHHH